MKVIVKRAEECLLNLLKQEQIALAFPFCLCVRGLMFKGDDYAVLPEILTSWIGSEDSLLFICNDRDLFLFSPNLDQSIFGQIKEIFPIRFPRPQVMRSKLMSLINLNEDMEGLINLISCKIDHLTEREKGQGNEKQLQMRASFFDMDTNGGLVDSISVRRHTHSKPVILIVEDDAFSRQLISTSLNVNMSVCFAEDGYSAISNYLLKAPNIVFLDINLPDVSGHDVLAKILSFDSSAFIVMLSGNSQTNNILNAINTGAKGFIGKPFTKDKLTQYIGKSIQHQTDQEGV